MIGADQVKKLRQLTGAGMMDCKRALEKTEGDIDAAVKHLREQGLAAAAKKSERPTGDGMIASYIHAGAKLGVLVELSCETDFVANTDDFKKLAHEVSMQVAAANPRWVSIEDVPEEVIQKERDILTGQAEKENKPAHVIEKIVDGRVQKFYAEHCLMEQPYIRDDDLTVKDLVSQTVAKLGENIIIRRFCRFGVGQDDE